MYIERVRIPNRFGYKKILKITSLLSLVTRSQVPSPEFLSKQSYHEEMEQTEHTPRGGPCSVGVTGVAPPHSRGYSKSPDCRDPSVGVPASIGCHSPHFYKGLRPSGEGWENPRWVRNVSPQRWQPAESERRCPAPVSEGRSRGGATPCRWHRAPPASWWGLTAVTAEFSKWLWVFN